MDDPIRYGILVVETTDVHSASAHVRIETEDGERIEIDGITEVTVRVGLDDKGNQSLNTAVLKSDLVKVNVRAGMTSVEQVPA